MGGGFTPGAGFLNYGLRAMTDTYSNFWAPGMAVFLRYQNSPSQSAPSELGFQPTTSALPAVVQHIAGINDAIGTSAILELTLGSPTASRNSILLTVYTDAGVVSIEDNQDNDYSSPTYTGALTVYNIQNIPGGPLTVTITFNDPTAVNLGFLQEVVNIAGLDFSNNNAGNSDIFSSGDLQTTQPGDFILGITAVTPDSLTLTPALGATEIDRADSATDQLIFQTQYQIAGNPGTYKSAWQLSPAGAYTAIGLAFLAASGTPGGGFSDTQVLPQPTVEEVSKHNIGISGGQLMFGAKTFLVSATFVDNMMKLKGYTDPYQVWRDPLVLGIFYNQRLYNIVSIQSSDVGGGPYSWNLTCNMAEQPVSPSLPGEIPPPDQGG